MAWAANAAFMEHLPDTLPVNPLELGRRMVEESRRLQGWSDSPSGDDAEGKIHTMARRERTRKRPEMR